MRTAYGYVASVLLLVGTSSCVQFKWERHDINSAPPVVDEQVLVEGQTSLDECLAALGAPLLVWEQNESSYALAYGWDKGREFGVSVSLPVADSGGSASFNYNRVASKLHGVVYIFDEHDVLVRRRRGYLRDLAPAQGQHRPAFLEEL